MEYIARLDPGPNEENMIGEAEQTNRRIRSHRRLEGTGGVFSGGEKNPLAVIPIASTPDPVPLLVVPLPIEMLPLLPPGPPPIIPFSMLIIDLAFPVVPGKFPPTPVPGVVCRDWSELFEITVLCRGL